MSEPFLSEIRMVGFNFAPRGWALCDGQILPINQNQSLYSLLGTTFGGDGRTTFGLPDLRSRSPRKGGKGSIDLGKKAGVENVTLLEAQLPPHTHSLQANTQVSDATTPEGNYLGKDIEPIIYGDASDVNVAMEKGTIGKNGGGQSHDNMQPFQVVNFCIALRGLFPSRN